MKFISYIVAACLLLLTACSSPAQGSSPQLKAQAQINGPGIEGTVKAIQTEKGFVWLAVELKGDPKILTPGLHGVHIHEKGACQEGTERPFSSAGGHFDPGPSGSSTPVEKNHPYHLGELPNIKINPIGQGRLEVFVSSVTLSEGPVSLFDADGSAIIIHKLMDQRKAGGTADEAGGGRLACGAIALVK
ncbi:superoxide dismutase family protein [Fortiea sp. LEGE XX443]|uniref:superoxide dismutase family protein n=1 Tax=Fortiea sp. LEGE XX443 TaxID=1828611 RepID=UPI001882D9C1|nr:superoxide dismutase family protein [Fortiea sp. LEGE XX443]MBE9005832.1 superoxide dismutase family protein [Fortiea sp. LEGE XX443]